MKLKTKRGSVVWLFFLERQSSNSNNHSLIGGVDGWSGEEESKQSGWAPRQRGRSKPTTNHKTNQIKINLNWFVGVVGCGGGRAVFELNKFNSWGRPAHTFHSIIDFDLLSFPFQQNKSMIPFHNNKLNLSYLF